jgi:hypothetical protein
MPFSVIPAKAGIQLFQDVLDPGFRRATLQRTSYEIIINCIISKLAEWDDFRGPEKTEEEGKFQGFPWRCQDCGSGS